MLLLAFIASFTTLAGEQKKLKQLTAQRAGEIAQLNDLKSIADQALENMGIHHNFRARYKHIDAMFKSFNDFHQKIILLVAPDEDGDFSTQVKIKSGFMNTYYDIEAIYLEIFAESASESGSARNAHASTWKNVRLPKIELPRFDGDIKKWQTLIDIFDSLIDNISELNYIDKYNYLIASLHKEPLSPIKRTPLSGQNYLVAYNSLKKRFNNPRLIATAHWHVLEQSKKLSNDIAHGLRSLIDTFGNNLSLLDNLGFEVISWDFPFTVIAPFQAIRTIRQFALNHKKDYPLASSAFLDDCYIDDIVSRAYSLEEALKLLQVTYLDFERRSVQTSEIGK